MDNKGLLFIPDISGFTRFVNETEIQHSRLIIQELLELLINANQIGLEVSEIEGDAILFYKFGESPDLEDLYKQVEKMFCAFHRHLMVYEHRRYCQCTACISAIHLTLKVITHYGEFTGYNVRQFSKLIGKDIIVAHQLLKNDIDQHEYWLVTNSLLQDSQPTGFAQWMQWNSSAKTTESGEIPFHYTQLSQLKNEIPPEPVGQDVLANKVKMITVSKEYETEMIPMFHATGDFRYRHRWLDGVKEVEELDHFLPRVGMRCRCVMENGEEIVYASSYTFHPERIVFTEMDEKQQHLTRYTLEKTGPVKARLTIDYYLRKNFLRQWLFTWKEKKKMEISFQRSLENLVEVVRGVRQKIGG